ncbi:MAG: hypothetical protein AB8H03_04370 [Saprospiraceae bacterium]
MKNLIKILFFSVICFPIFCFGQNSKWIFSSKSNIAFFKIEDDIVNRNFNPQFSLLFNIYRKSTPLLGWSVGMKRRFKFMDNFYFLTGLEFRLSQLKKQEWLESSSGEIVYDPKFEMNDIILNGTINRELLDTESNIFSFNSYPKEAPFETKTKSIFLDLPLNFHFESLSRKWLVSAGFNIGISLKSIVSHPYILTRENIFLGVNANVDYRFFKNYYLSLGFTNFEKGVNIFNFDLLEIRNQNIFSFGISCLIKP